MEKEKIIEEWKKRKKYLMEHLGAGKLFLLVLAGVFLVLGTKTGKEEGRIENKEEIMQQTDVEELEEYISRQENKLERILSKVEGIGVVDVMITAKTSKEKITLKDVPYQRKETSEKDSSGGVREQTEISSEETSVMGKEENGNEMPYVTKEIQPEIEGVVVIASGAKDVQIISEINEAVEALFHVPVHKIKVMKMK